jgi:hypothetical protein
MVKTRSCDVAQDLEAAMPVRDLSVKEEMLEVRSFVCKRLLLHSVCQFCKLMFMNLKSVIPNQNWKWIILLDVVTGC